MAQSKNWKNVEREIGIRFFPGSKRRGADYGGVNGGKSDLIFEGWSVEIKTNKRPTFGLMKGAVEQAERNREKPGDIPVAVIHPHGANYGDSLVVMRLSEFSNFFINRPEEPKDEE